MVTITSTAVLVGVAGGKRIRIPMSRLLRWWDSSRIPATFNPVYSNTKEGKEARGRDERIRIEEVPRGPQILFDLVEAAAAEKYVN